MNVNIPQLNNLLENKIIVKYFIIKDKKSSLIFIHKNNKIGIEVKESSLLHY